MFKLRYIFIFIVAILLGGLIFSTYRLGCYRKECEQYRVQLESVRDRESELKEAVRYCYDSVGRTAVILSESADTIRDLKERLKEARVLYEDMENRLSVLIYDNDIKYSSNTDKRLKNEEYNVIK